MITFITENIFKKFNGLDFLFLLNWMQLFEVSLLIKSELLMQTLQITAPLIVDR
jgi:hypothetical protein